MKPKPTHRLLPAIGSLLLAASALAAELAPLDLGGVREEHLMIPMRDGAKLSAYVYFPAGEGKWPAVFQQRYADITGKSTREGAARLARAGYVAANVNFRGSHDSEGTWVGYRALTWGALRDGYDICEWLGTQEWCTGRVGTFGGSQAGYAQNFLAPTQPPHLVCQYMMDTGLSLYHEGYAVGGAFRPGRHAKLGENARNPDDHKALMAEWYQHPRYDDYWKLEDASKYFPNMNVPCFIIGSWYDFMNVGSIKSWIGRNTKGGPNSKDNQWLLIGPWLHGGQPKPNKVGDLVYPENAGFDVYGHMIEWFDYWLKDTANSISATPAVKYYVMGATGEPGAPGNEWRTADDWPPRSFSKSWYLNEGGKLDLLSPTSAKSSTSYVSDPRNPAQIPGTSFPGARDAQEYEKQPGVLTFTSDPLPKPEEWTGLVKAELVVSTTARDTDFIVRVSDVYPDGRSILIIDTIRRARYKESFEYETLLKPDKIYKLTLDIGWLSQVFNAGHRIRVTVASTGAPFYEPNPQTGAPLTIAFPENAVVATNTLYHSRVDSSRIIAPIPDISTGIGIARPRVRPQQTVAGQPGQPIGPIGGPNGIVIQQGVPGANAPQGQPGQTRSRSNTPQGQPSRDRR